jgi:hypothetical protein
MLLVPVADLKPCEDGWVLHLAINHKRQVLPFRIRDGADWPLINLGNWSDGQQLTENTRDSGEDREMFKNHGGGDGGGIEILSTLYIVYLLSNHFASVEMKHCRSLRYENGLRRVSLLVCLSDLPPELQMYIPEPKVEATMYTIYDRTYQSK